MSAAPAALRVLVTRPAGQADDWVAHLRGQGVDAQALPLIGIAPAADPEIVRQAWQRLASLRLVIFVSPNAVEQFFALRPADHAWPLGLRAASPGPGTSEALRCAGLADAQIVAPAADAAQFDSESLWAALSHEDWYGAAVLLVRGGEGEAGEGREWLSERLRERGALLEALAAYRRTVPLLDEAQLALLRESLTEPARHLWLFSSSQAIAHLRELAGSAGLPAPGPASRALATHPRIAEAARAAGFAEVHETGPSVEAVLACVGSLGGDTPSIQSSAAFAMEQAAITPNQQAAAAAPAVQAAAPQRPPESGVLAKGSKLLVGVLVLGIAASLGLAWSTQQRLHSLEQELVRRQQDSQSQAGEASMLAKQAQELARDAAAKAALVEARVAEVALQRSQLDELIQSLSRSRDENLVSDLDAALRVAVQQASITGSAEPVVAALKSADERLARVNQPRLQGVRRAVARDLDRVKAVGVADISSMIIKLDEVVRLVDELPLLSSMASAAPHAQNLAPKPATRSATGRGGAPQAASAPEAWSDKLMQWWPSVWAELRSLVRVTRIDTPEAMLITPEQGFFLRENLKLKLLNARLALLSRQFDVAQTDLQASIAALGRYFDNGTRRTTTAVELLRQVAAQSRQVVIPRPDDTLAALATAAAGR